MPTYDMKCKNPHCKEEFEDIRKMSDPKPDCPKCGTACEVLLNPTSSTWKGGPPTPKSSVR